MNAEIGSLSFRACLPQAGEARNLVFSENFLQEWLAGDV
jgi:hypothetical protein